MDKLRSIKELFAGRHSDREVMINSDGGGTRGARTLLRNQG